MEKRHLMTLLIVAVAYVVGARWPMLAKKVGLA